MNRFFEKISYSQFKKELYDDSNIYDEYELPCRGSKNSYGYDFFAIRDIVLHPRKILKILTGYKAIFNNGEFLMIVVRGGKGFKYTVRMCN